MSWTRNTLVLGASLLVTLPALAGEATPIFTPEVMVEEPAAEGSYGVRPVLAIGGPDADEPAQFYERLGSVLVSADAKGNIYVLDNGNARVQVFDAEGSFRHGFGAEGEGPGEFKMPARMSVNHSGACAVWDMAQQRVSIFDGTGELVRDQVVSGMVRDIRLADDGSLFVAFERKRPATVVRYDAEGNEAWRYGVPTEPERGNIQMIKVESGVRAPALTVAGDRIFVPSDDAYCVRPVSMSGDALTSFARVYERQEMKLPERSKDDDEDGGGMVFIAVEREGGHGGGGDGEAGGPKTSVSIGDGEGEWTLNADDLADFMPEFTPDINGVLAWSDGRLWILTSQGDDNGTVVDEWTVDGKFTKSFELEGDYAVMQIGADGALYAVGHDEDDYPLVYRLEVSGAM